MGVKSIFTSLEIAHIYIKFEAGMELILRDNKVNEYRSLPKNRGMQMNHSSIQRQPVLFINHQDSVDKASDQSQRIAASDRNDCKPDSTYDGYADRLGSPKRMR